MVTASHNPPQDNGYKVYLGDGSQIVPPADAEIAAQIDAVGAVGRHPAGTGGRCSTRRSSTATSTTVAELAGGRPARPRHRLHAAARRRRHVGARRSSRPPGSPQPPWSPQQAEPDPDFPTVAFPNPEEPGAMDLALALARAAGADLVVANDPDADRCAVAVPDRTAGGC